MEFEDLEQIIPHEVRTEINQQVISELFPNLPKELPND